ncbi:MAG: Transposase [Firmicutes bacterium ADurb.Bin146]|jgi:transposase|nr:MAG: Transposase [Firmicutes bacterium ADurb.Bin146]
MTESIPRKERRAFTLEFKSQVVQLYQNGKRKCDILREYDLSASLLDRWIKQSETTGSFNKKDNRTDEENELIELRNRNKQLEMENDILNKQRLIKSIKYALGEDSCNKA